MATPFDQMNDTELEALARKLGVQMPPRAPLPAGDYGLPGAGQPRQLIPLGPDGSPRLDPASSVPGVLPQPQGLPQAHVVGQAGMPAAPDPAAEAAWFKPPAAEGGSGKGVPSPQPFAPPAAPFVPSFVPTGMPGIGQGVYATNRDQELAALAQQTATRTAGNIGGTGFGASGDYYTPNGAGFNLAAHSLGQQAGENFLKMALEREKGTGADVQHEANRQAEVQKAQIAGQAHVEGAKAAHSPEALRGQGQIELLRGILSGRLSPQDAQGGAELIRSMGGPQGGSFDATAQKLTQNQGARAGAAGALGTQGPEGFQPLKDLTPENMNDLADRLLRMSPEARTQVGQDILAGHRGDSQKVIEALARQAAANSFRAQPITGQNGQPLDLMKAQPGQIPGSYGIKGPDDNPLMTLGVKPTGSFPLGNRVGPILHGGVPYNQLQIQGGPTIDIDPAMLGGLLESRGLRPPPDRSVLTGRAGVQNELLMNLIRQRQAAQQAQPQPR